jgi:hypothetical protein
VWSEDLCLPCWVPADAERPHYSRFHQGIKINNIGYQSFLLLHREKSFSIFPSPAGMSLTKLSLDGNNDVIYKLFPPRKSLVSDIPAGHGNIYPKTFLQCVGIGFFTHTSLMLILTRLVTQIEKTGSERGKGGRHYHCVS